MNGASAGKAVRAVVRPATALDGIHGGLKEDLTFRPLQLRPKTPVT